MQEPKGIRGASRRRRWTPGALAVGLALIVTLLAEVSGGNARLNGLIFDAEIAAARRFAPVAVDDVVVVGIDQETVDEIAAPIALWHEEVGAVLAAIAQAHPRLVALDLVLPEHSSSAYGSRLDLTLLKGIVAARAVHPAGGIVLALQTDASGALRSIYLPFVTAAGAGGAGAAVYRVEVDGVVRYFDPEVSAFTAAIAARLGQSVHHGYIDYSRGEAFSYVSMADVLRRARSGDGEWASRQFAGRTIVVGSVLPGLDRRRQPARLAAWDPPYAEPPATLIHAQAIRTMLTGGFIREAPLIAVAAATLAFALIASAPGAVSRWLTLGIASAATFGLGAAGLRAGWFFPLAFAWVAGSIAAAARSAYDGWHFLRERNRLARLFEGYVSPPVFRAVVAGDLAAVGKAPLAILFADVRGFTTLTEQSAAEVVLEVLNRYYGAVTPILHAHGATIDAFRGDGLNAMFGAPEPMPEPARSAFAAARAMLAALPAINESLADARQAPLAVGIGLSFGEVVFGDVGSTTDATSRWSEMPSTLRLVFRT